MFMKLPKRLSNIVIGGGGDKQGSVARALPGSSSWETPPDADVLQQHCYWGGRGGGRSFAIGKQATVILVRIASSFAPPSFVPPVL